jgi:Leucine-rich repeat (LRR) protein
LRNVRHLDLSGNVVLHALDGIGSLACLEWLDASGNALTEFSPELTSLHWLQYLDLSDNKINALPENFGQLGYICRLLYSNK